MIFTRLKTKTINLKTSRKNSKASTTKIKVIDTFVGIVTTSISVIFSVTVFFAENSNYKKKYFLLQKEAKMRILQKDLITKLFS